MNTRGVALGYLKYQKIRLLTGITTLHAEAGGHSQSSSVIYDGTSIVAKHGQEGMSDHQHGAGYSRGGQWTDGGSGYGGGSGGSDGVGTDGGSGTHEDISEYIFNSWTLTPGDGGSAFYGDSGGGGGIMVNSGGPGGDKYKGQGYGGGGNGQISHNTGYPGLVLLETSSAG